MWDRFGNTFEFVVKWLDTRSKVQALGRTILALLVLGVVGGLVFQWLERDTELHRYKLNRAIYESLVGSTDFHHCHHPAFKDVGYCRQHEHLEVELKLFLESAGNSLTDRSQWTWLGSFFFVFHLISTVGYATEGAPETTGGKLFAVLFGSIGIPLFGCALVLVSPYLLGAARAIFGRCLGLGSDRELPRAQLVRLAAVATIALWTTAALLFTAVEGWSYARSVFFCFMTFSTVGIGTDVPRTLTGQIASVAYAFVSMGLSLGIIRSLSRARRGEEQPLIPGIEASSKWRLPKVELMCFAAVAVLCGVGGFVLPHFERQSELNRYARAASIYEGLNEMAAFKGCDEELIRGMDFCKNVPIFRKRLHVYFGPETANSVVDRRHWTGLGSASFVMSLASTIGYGSQSPHTPEGKVATLLLGIFVVPLFWYCMLVWGSSFRWLVHGFVQKAWPGMWISWGETQRSLISLFGAVMVLWTLGSIAFLWLEDWDSATSAYFCFVTLAAVGLDYTSPKTILGRIVMLVYISVGLTSVAALFEECAGMLATRFGLNGDDRAQSHVPVNTAAPCGVVAEAAVCSM